MVTALSLEGYLRFGWMRWKCFLGTEGSLSQDVKVGINVFDDYILKHGAYDLA